MSGVTILENSLFDPQRGLSAASILIKGKSYTITSKSLKVPSFLRKKFSLLNPLQLVFYACLKQKFKNKPFSSIILSPTSSGKTGVILLYVKHFLSLYQNNRKPAIIYVSPLKALAREKYDEFREVFGNVVELRTGDNLIRSLSGKDILVCTPDYLSLAVRNNLYFLSNVKTIVVDEVHTIFSSGDRPVIDEVLWYIKETKKPFLVLSATIPLVENLIEFLQPDLFVECRWKPVKTIRYVKSLSAGGSNTFSCPFKNSCTCQCPILSGKQKLSQTEKFVHAVIRETFKTISDNGIEKTILFVGSKKEGWKILEFLNHFCGFNILNSEDDIPFERKENPSTELLSAFYCADIDPKARALIETRFRKNPDFRILISTHSLAYGVNFPADLSVVTVTNRKTRTVVELWPNIIDCIQMAGRSGRFGYSDKGHVLFLLKHKRTLPEAKKYLENPETYPFEPAGKNMDNLCANALLYAAKRNIPYTSCRENSFLLYLSDRSFMEIREVHSFLVENSFITDGGLTGKGDFCFRSGVSPFTYGRIEMFYSEIEKSISENFTRTLYRFFLSSPLASTFEATYDFFTGTFFSRPESPVFVKAEILRHLPSWHFLRSLERFYFLDRMVDSEIFPQGITQQEKDARTIASISFYVTGVYFLSGLPKVLPDLGYIPPSAFIFYTRNLKNLALNHGMFRMVDVLLFTHMLDLGALPPVLCICLPIKTRKLIKGLGPLRVAMLNLLIQKLGITQFRAEDFIYMHRTFNRLREEILSKRREFLEGVEEILSSHLSRRKVFRKKVDEKRIIHENRTFFREFLNVLEKFTAPEDVYYRPFLLELFHPSTEVYLARGDKKGLLNYLKLHLLV